MKMHVLRRDNPIMFALFLGGILAAPLAADEAKPSHSAVTPESRNDNARWKARHEAFLERAKEGGVDLLFLGDSITQGWEGAGKTTWEKTYASQKAANFGIGGDRTQHVLWRITTGKELEGIKPRVAVLMIGTNNMASNSAEEIADGVTAIVRELRRQKPMMKVLLLGIFPRGAQSTDRFRGKIKEVNEQIAKLDDGKSIRYLDIGPKFLDEDGTLSKEIMPDLLHLSPKGYQIWADAIASSLEKMLAK